MGFLPIKRLDTLKRPEKDTALDALEKVFMLVVVFETDTFNIQSQLFTTEPPIFIDNPDH